MPWIKQCLNSCREYPVLVVDNNSSDGTVAFIKENFPEVQLLPQKENLGFGQGNNLGIRYTMDQGAEYVFLLNQDAYLQEGCLKKMVGIQKKNSDYGILSPIHLNGKGDRLDKNFSNYVAYTYNPNFYSDYILNKPLEPIYEVPFVNAAGWLLSKDILEIVGGFDPIFFHYGEDSNYCQRAKYHGFKIGIVPTAFLQHDREDRVASHIEKGSPEYFERMERTFKRKYGNINVEYADELNAIINSRKRNKFKASLKMKFSQVKFLNKEIVLLTQIAPKIQKSRELNKKQQANYL